MSLSKRRNFLFDYLCHIPSHCCIHQMVAYTSEVKFQDEGHLLPKQQKTEETVGVRVQAGGLLPELTISIEVGLSYLQRKMSSV